MPGLPTGTVTFLFTDIEGSTRLVQQLGDRYAQILAEYRRLLHTTTESLGGREINTWGDACFVVFPRAQDAVTAAISIQHALAARSWPEGMALRVRMGLHTGQPLATEIGYVGLEVHRAARICAVGHGGQILLSQATRDLVAETLSAGSDLLDLGEHRLKDLPQSDHIFQIVAPGLPVDFPAIKVVPNNLPLQLTSFVGRQRAIAEVRRLLATTRLLTLTGAGGVGKTRLGYQVGAELLGEVPDGVWVADLAALSDPALVPQRVGAALGVRERPGKPFLAMFVETLQPKEILLLLDNCEHLIVACRHLALTLLNACPKLRILATSQESLGITGEMTYPVPPLSLPDLRRPRISLEDLGLYEATRLFVERAQRGITLTDSSAPAVVQVCRRLDGIPLAIELAAARAKVLSVEQIAAQMDDRFRLLTVDDRVALPRHQTLRTALDWSYGLLSKRARTLLARLSVFAGGWTLEASETVCAGAGLEAADVLDLLAQLVDKSLVVVEMQGGEARYRLLETVRQYSRDKLEESRETATVCSLHLDWYLGLAERANPNLDGPEQSLWLEQLETEHDNLGAALEWSRNEGTAETELRLSAALGRFWAIRAHWSEGRTWLDGALARGGDARVPFLSRALELAAYFADCQGNSEHAAALSEKGLVVCQEMGDRRGVAHALHRLGSVARSQGDYERAAGLFSESLAIHRELGARRDIAVVLNELGHVARAQGDLKRAAALYADSLTLSQTAGDKFMIANALANLGTVAVNERDYERAVVTYTQSLALCKEVGAQWFSERCLEGLAGVACGLGNFEQAARLLGAVEALCERLSSRRLAIEQLHYEQCAASARAALGDASFLAAWEEGRAMTLEQAIEYALKEED